MTAPDLSELKRLAESVRREFSIPFKDEDGTWDAQWQGPNRGKKVILANQLAELAVAAAEKLQEVERERDALRGTKKVLLTVCNEVCNDDENVVVAVRRIKRQRDAAEQRVAQLEAALREVRKYAERMQAGHAPEYYSGIAIEEILDAVPATQPDDPTKVSGEEG